MCSGHIPDGCVSVSTSFRAAKAFSTFQQQRMLNGYSRRIMTAAVSSKNSDPSTDGLEKSENTAHSDESASKARAKKVVTLVKGNSESSIGNKSNKIKNAASRSPISSLDASTSATTMGSEPDEVLSAEDQEYWQDIMQMIDKWVCLIT
jgi:hypothetical protein